MALSGDIYEKNERRGVKVFNILLTVVLVLLAALLIFYAMFAPVTVIGESMCDTLKDGQVVAINRLSSNCKVGDIAVIKTKTGNIIKRVVAVGGDKIAFAQHEDGKIYFYRNGWTKPVNEPYIKEAMTHHKFHDMKVAPTPAAIEKGDYIIEIKKGEIFVLGDNRNHSDDSRYTGAMKESDVLGVMTFTISGNPFLEMMF